MSAHGFYKRYGLAVRDAREALGWSQNELARLLSAEFGEPFYQTTIARIESGSRPVRLDEARALNAVLGLNVGGVAISLDGSASTDATITALRGRLSRVTDAARAVMEAAGLS